jgi:hypothetical protein
LQLKLHLRASCVLLLLASPALAQLPHEKTSEASTASGQPPLLDQPDVPGLSAPVRGWNAGLTISGFHESSSGWATLATPAIGYSFNDIFSVDATIPIYFYRLAESRSTRPRPDARLVNQRGEPGDLVLDIRAQFIPRHFQYEITGAVTAPTGDEAYGLTTGRVTFDISNHFERTFGRLTPNLEIGGGDSTTLVNRILTKNYTSLGPLAHAQIGLNIELFHGISFETDAYEQLPIGDQKIYGPSRNGKATVVVGHSVTEDNGFINSVDIPVTNQITFSGSYGRSLRLRSDTVAIGVTYVLRTSPPAESTSTADLFR